MVARGIGLPTHDYKSKMFARRSNSRCVVHERGGFLCLIDTTTDTEELLGVPRDESHTRSSPESVTYFVSGDVTYAERFLKSEQVDGVTYDPAVSLLTLQRIKAFATQQQTILLPAHDPEVPARLTGNKLLD